jgi:hypothetical protein
MKSVGGTVPAPAHASSQMEQAISALAPQQYSENEIEQLVQTITDQIMAAAS